MSSMTVADWREGARILAMTGMTYVSEMKDTSETIHDGMYGRSSAVTSRMLVPLMSMTRGSCATLGASCPCPTSSAMTWLAPRCSSTWVKPPVDAPMSRHGAPSTDGKSNVSNAPTSFHAPRDTYPSSLTTRRSSSAVTLTDGLPTTAPLSSTLPASMSACARVRDEARPRSTRAMSQRRDATCEDFMASENRCLRSPSFINDASSRACCGCRAERIGRVGIRSRLIAGRRGFRNRLSAGRAAR